MTRSLVDKRLGRSLKHFYPSRCTIQTPTGGRGAAGSATRTYADSTDAAYVDLACSIAMHSGGEVQRKEQTLTMGTHRIAFQERVDGLTTSMKAKVDGVVYDILRIDVDAHAHATYLEVELVS